MDVKTIDTLVADIEALFDGHDLNAALVSGFAGSVGRNLTKRFGRYNEEYQGGLYLSNVGKPLRQL